MFLSDEDVRKLTGRKKPRSQMHQLDRLGIRYYIDADLRPVVLKENVVQAEQVTRKSRPEPNWSAINGTAKQAN